MFAKLLKHEWRATKGVLALLCLIILISGMTAGLSARYLMVAEDNEFMTEVESVNVMVNVGNEPRLLEVMCILMMMVGVFAIGFCWLGGFFLFLSRFYKRCFTDEGYLTFTLPVTGHQILLSGIANTVLGMLVVMAAAVAGIGIILGLFMTAFPQEILWADVWVSLKEAMAQIVESLRKNAGEFTMLGISGIIGAFATLIELMMAITIGALIAKKHKIIAAVAVYYGINMAMGMVQSIFAMTVVFSQNLIWLLGSTILLSSVAAVGGYFLMYWLTSRKLNLT